MKKKRRIVLPVISALIVIAAVAVLGRLASRYIPSNEWMDQQEYFDTRGDEIALIMQDQLVRYKGMWKDDRVYLEHEAVIEYLNQRFYWDESEALLLFTTPTQIYKIPADSREYMVDDETRSEEYVIAFWQEEILYLDAEFVKRFTFMEYEFMTDPNRAVIRYEKTPQTAAVMKKATSVRFQGGIKSPILTKVSKNDRVWIVDEMEDWTRVLTADGYLGYVKNTTLGDRSEETLEIPDFTEPVYTSLTQDEKINLVWHQVTNEDANDSLLDELEGVEGVNVISPTWFSVIDNDGNISSLADKTYVRRAHRKGMQVWALIDNFNVDVDTETVLSSMAARENIQDQLIEAALEYSLDGINIDFEAIPQSAGEDYIQFIREMSVKCRENEIVLSIDNPVPQPYTAHYNRREQGIVADYVIIMGYDEHYVGSDVGSVATMNFVRSGIESTIVSVPCNKVINAIPFYVRIWNTDSQGNISSEAVSMGRAQSVVEEAGAEIQWDENAEQNYAEWYASDGSLYQVWLEDDESVDARAKLTETYRLGGIAAWKLGLEETYVWDVISKYIAP
ncbi:MAG: glycosyl hydrolase family 18 protein [Lachnospiraceae bacterium]|nr:glycosyl hydrolase family 18 protein [Lachnospiraceae bacterium]